MHRELHWIYSEGLSFIIVTKHLSLVVDRLLYGTTKGHKDMVHREQDDYNRQGESPRTQSQIHTMCICLVICAYLKQQDSKLCVLNSIGLLVALLLAL